MIFHPNKTWAYVLTELSNKIHCFDLSSDGKLVKKSIFNALPENFGGNSYAADILIDPSGEYLYTTNRGHESIGIFSISKSDGNLKYMDHVSSEGKFPWSMDISEGGVFLMVTNQHSNNVVIFKRDLSSGSISKFQEIREIEHPVSARFLLLHEEK
jgi:6-phosphogluconolactonase